MNRSRPFLLSALALVSLGGLALAQPAPDSVKYVAASKPEVTAVTPCVAEPCEDGTADGRSGFLAGAALYLVQPYFQSNIAYTTSRDVGTRGDPNFTRSDDRTDISHHMQATPLIWLGYLGDNGWGARARYWYFLQDSAQAVEGTAPPPPAGGSGLSVFSAAPLGLQVAAFANEQLSVTSRLELQLLDLEGLRHFNAAGCDFLIAGGLRLAHIDQTYNAFLATDGRTIDTLLSGHNFHGAGPVLAGEVRYPLGLSGLVLYGSARSSLVFGSAHQEAFLTSQNSSGADHRDKALLIAEADLGLEYAMAVGQSRLFGQVALVGQNWFGAGGASRATPEVVPGGGFDARGSFVQDSDIGFLGVAFRIGLNY